jgi:hypothetical protein
MRKSLYGLVIVLLFALLLVNSQVYAGQKFIPLKIGQTAIYDVAQGSDTWEYKILVSGIARIGLNKKSYYVIESWGESEPDEYSLDLVRSTSKEFYYYMGFGEEKLRWQHAPVGTTWTYYDFVDDETMEFTIEAVETIGTFEGCLRIFYKCISCESTDLTYEWIKPGFFMVKQIDYHPDGLTRVTELKSWTD